MELSKGIDTKAEYDSQRACETFIQCEYCNNIVSGDDGTKKGTQLSLIEESYINKESQKQMRFQCDQFISC